MLTHIITYKPAIVANHNCGVLIGLLCCVDKPLVSMMLKGRLPVEAPGGSEIMHTHTTS